MGGGGGFEQKLCAEHNQRKKSSIRPNFVETWQIIRQFRRAYEDSHSSGNEPPVSIMMTIMTIFNNILATI